LREESAAYELEKTKTVVDSLSNAHFIPVIENPQPTWQGRTGLVHQAAMQDITSFEGYDIYLAGRFDMVGAIRGDFIAQGALIENMFADAFAFI
jgi:aquacobalamin reductase/NAD(P)H-flavin reductase